MRGKELSIVRNDTNFVVAFFEEARNVSLGNKKYMEAGSRDLLAIAMSPATQAEFRRQLLLLNDPELHDQIVQFVLALAEAEDDNESDANRRVDLLDRAGLGVAASVTAAGIGATTASLLSVKAIVAGSLLGPVGLLVGGLVGLCASAIGRHHLKRRADGSKSAARKLRRLVGK